MAANLFLSGPIAWHLRLRQYYPGQEVMNEKNNPVLAEPPQYKEKQTILPRPIGVIDEVKRTIPCKRSHDGKPKKLDIKNAPDISSTGNQHSNDGCDTDKLHLSEKSNVASHSKKKSKKLKDDLNQTTERGSSTTSTKKKDKSDLLTKSESLHVKHHNTHSKDSDKSKDRTSSKYKKHRLHSSNQCPSSSEKVTNKLPPNTKSGKLDNCELQTTSSTDLSGSKNVIVIRSIANDADIVENTSLQMKCEKVDIPIVPALLPPSVPQTQIKEQITYADTISKCESKVKTAIEINSNEKTLHQSLSSSLVVDDVLPTDIVDSNSVGKKSDSRRLLPACDEINENSPSSIVSNSNLEFLTNASSPSDTSDKLKELKVCMNEEQADQSKHLKLQVDHEEEVAMCSEMTFDVPAISSSTSCTKVANMDVAISPSNNRLDFNTQLPISDRISAPRTNAISSSVNSCNINRNAMIVSNVTVNMASTTGPTTKVIKAGVPKHNVKPAAVDLLSSIIASMDNNNLTGAHLNSSGNGNNNVSFGDSGCNLNGGNTSNNYNYTASRH